MKLCAFNLETTGLDPQRDQILQIGAVVFDHEDVETPVDELPTFSTFVRHNRYKGNPFALHMNAWILRKLANGEGVSIWSALNDFYDFLDRHVDARHLGRVYPVGFNVAAFDVAFVKAAARRDKAPNPTQFFNHRPIELGSLLSTDGLPVTSREAVEDMSGGAVKHDALEDARDAVRLYRIARKASK